MSEPSKSKARRAGKRLTKWWAGELVLSEEEFAAEVAVIQAWRQQHAYPLSLTTPGLRNWIEKETDVRPIPVAQRMKQLTTIIGKLGRHPGMNIDRMQDIAGCRGILPDAAAVKRERRVEIQLRTTQQHRWAEIVAGTGERLGYALKDGHGPADLLEYFRMASDMLWLREQGRSMSPSQRKRFAELRETVRPYFAPRD